MDKQQFENLLVENYEKIRPLMTKILWGFESDVDDVMQSAAIDAWKAFASFEGRSGFKTWYIRIAINRAYYHLRQEKARHVADFVEIKEWMGVSDFTPEDYAIQKNESEILWESIMQLSQLQRRAILQWMGGKKLAKKSTLKSRVHHAKVSLRKRLEESKKGIARTVGTQSVS